jgi:hypothetical protein
VEKGEIEFVDEDEQHPNIRLLGGEASVVRILVRILVRKWFAEPQKAISVAVFAQRQVIQRKAVELVIVCFSQLTCFSEVH